MCSEEEEEEETLGGAISRVENKGLGSRLQEVAVVVARCDSIQTRKG